MVARHRLMPHWLFALIAKPLNLSLSQESSDMSLSLFGENSKSDELFFSTQSGQSRVGWCIGVFLIASSRHMFLSRYSLS